MPTTNYGADQFIELSGQLGASRRTLQFDFSKIPANAVIVDATLWLSSVGGAPTILSFGILINLLAGIVLGGWGTFWGPIFGTAIMIVLPEVLREVDVYRIMSIGVILALLAVFAVRGLGPLIADGVRRLKR